MRRRALGRRTAGRVRAGRPDPCVRPGADLHQRARASASCGRRSPGTTGAGTGSTSPRRSGGHHRVLGRLPARLPRRLQRGRPGGAGPARLPGLPQHPARARLRGGGDRLRARDPLPAHAGAAGRRGCRPWAARRAGAGLARQPHRHHGDRAANWPPSPPGAPRTASGWSATRSTTASPTRPTGAEPDARGTCAWELDRTGVVISSFSKYWGMTGWRLGWALMPDDLAGRDRRARRERGAVPAGAGPAGRAGGVQRGVLRGGRRCGGRLRRGARGAAANLDRLRWGTAAPADGAFYLYADLGDQLSGFADSADYCRALLEKRAWRWCPAPISTRGQRHPLGPAVLRRRRGRWRRPWNGSSGSRPRGAGRGDTTTARPAIA